MNLAQKQPLILPISLILSLTYLKLSLVLALVTDHVMLFFFKPKHQIIEVSVVMLEYPHIEENNPVSGAK